MPKIGQTHNDPEPEQLAAVLELWDAFRDPCQWRQTAKGNWTREWDDRVVTVLRSRKVPGRWQWCIAEDDGPQFSRDTYGCEEDAQTALGESLGLSD